SAQKPPNTQKKNFLRFPRVLRATSCLVLALAAFSDAQPATRRATNLAALHSYPGFYHGRPIVLVGKVALEQNGQLRVSDDTVSLHVVFKGNAPDGLDEVRG